MRTWIFAVTAWSSLAAGSSLAAAQLTPDESALALAVAKVAVNEASMGATQADIALIWQVTQSHGRTAAARLDWLSRHSSCVLGAREITDRERRFSNCGWTRNLTDSDAQPEGWPADWRWSSSVRRWRQHRAFARALVGGRARMRPCPETPYTWGGRVIDMAQALRRGLRPVGCVGTANEGFVPRGA